jgi:hypothetical protein
MENNVRPQGSSARPYRKTLRLTFRVVDGEVQLVSHEQLDMICPPAIGERPEAGKHGGFWMELRDANDRLLFHRTLNSPLGDSVEVHSPDGKITRQFGTPVKENFFEVLLPAYDDASSVALMGEYLDTAKASAEGAEGSRELARFDIPKGDKDGEGSLKGGGQ